MTSLSFCQILVLSIMVNVTVFFICYNYWKKSAYPVLYNTSWSQRKVFSEAYVFDSGWNQEAFGLFQQTLRKLNDHKATQTVTFPIGGLTARVSGIDTEYWKGVEKGSWEIHTYATFMQYITSDTIVVDFGCWIGPTILFHSQLAARIYAIESDPVAFAKASYNLKQNTQTPWYNRVHLQAGCVGVKSGLLEMKSANPGNSESSFHKIFREQIHSVTVNWTVRCYTLASMFEAWQIDSETAHVFIKIDIESYECQLIPSLYSWLANMKRKPTLYIAMHKQIVACTDDQYAQIAKLSILFRFRSKSFIDDKGNVSGTGEYVLSDVMAPT